ncbi:MAG: cyclic nucleotide-binding domain-containing protein [Anaerolineales bacterium]
MQTTLSERVAQFKEMALFQELDDDQLEIIAARFHDHKLPPNQLLYGAGDRAENFYIVISGQLLNQEIREGQRVGEYLLEPGDPFGAEALLGSTERQAAVSALRLTQLLYLTDRDFQWMLAEFPQVAGSLRHLLAGRELLAKVEFDWLEDNEVVYYVARKHASYLWLRVARAAAVAIAGMLALYFAIGAEAGQQFYLVLAGATLLFGAGGLGIWEAMDWRNDYYLITNLRVVWLEQVLLSSSSRIEAPLASTQSVDIHTSLMGRLMGFGDIIVRTFTGIVLMPSVSDPVRTKHLIEDYAARTKRQNRQERHESIRQAVRESLGQSAESDTSTPSQPRLPMVDRSQRFSLFKTRTVSGDTITYHKHWFTLLSSLALPALFAIAVLIGPPIVLGGLLESPLGLAVTVIAFLTPVGLIIYRILDWQNDMYIVSPDKLVDTEKKPLGSEVTKSAPLANVLSLENHKVGLLGLLLNFGEVRISVGDASLVFTHVSDPALVQQDIFARMEALKSKQQKSQAEEERQRMTEWLRVYEEERTRGQAPEASE